MKNYLILLAFFIANYHDGNCDSAIKRRVLLICFDGFRYNYLDYYKPENFSKFASSGILAPSGMVPVFPTKTFPNHYSIVTGLYPESHGVVDNLMYDPVFNDTFDMSNNETRWYDKAEPIWISARLQGLKTGTFYWPASSVLLHNTTANFYADFDMANENMPFKKRVDTVIGWFVKEDISFSTLYFEQPDGVGHEFGAFSNPVQTTVAYLDEILGYIMDELDRNKLAESTDVIIVSDHGMVNVSKQATDAVLLDQYVNSNDYLIVAQTGPIAAIMPREGKKQYIYDKLKNAHPNVTIYLKENLPERLHYQNNRRIMPIIAIADPGYSITFNETTLRASAKGNHGYDNALMEMRPIFLAKGPSFKQNVKMEAFQNFEIYALMCHILKIQAKPNNCSLDTWKTVLRSDGSEQSDDVAVLPNSALPRTNIHNNVFLFYILILNTLIFYFKIIF